MRKGKKQLNFKKKKKIIYLHFCDSTNDLTICRAMLWCCVKIKFFTHHNFIFNLSIRRCFCVSTKESKKRNKKSQKDNKKKRKRIQCRKFFNGRFTRRKIENNLPAWQVAIPFNESTTFVDLDEPSSEHFKLFTCMGRRTASGLDVFWSGDPIWMTCGSTPGLDHVRVKKTKEKEKKRRKKSSCTCKSWTSHSNRERELDLGRDSNQNKKRTHQVSRQELILNDWQWFLTRIVWSRDHHQNHLQNQALLWKLPENIYRKVDDIENRNECQRSVKTINNIVQNKLKISYFRIALLSQSTLGGNNVITCFWTLRKTWKDAKKKKRKEKKKKRKKKKECTTMLVNDNFSIKKQREEESVKRCVWKKEQIRNLPLQIACATFNSSVAP